MKRMADRRSVFTRRWWWLAAAVFFWIAGSGTALALEPGNSLASEAVEPGISLASEAVEPGISLASATLEPDISLASEAVEPGISLASDTEEEQAGAGDIDLSLLEELDFSQVESLLDRQEDTAGIRFGELVKMLVQGEEVDKKWLFETCWDILFQEIAESKGYLVQIVLIAAAFGLLHNFANVFEKGAVSDISFYIVYMILVAILMRSLLLMSGLLTDTLKLMLDFMRALLPAFCLTIVISTGSVTAMGFYQLTLFVIYLIEAALNYIVLPAVHAYVVLELLNHLTNEDMISKMTGLVKGGVEWMLKFLFTLVIGINVVQGLLSPAIDSFKTSLFARTASMLPGFGNAVNAVAEIMVGSGIIIKNGVGLAGIIAVILLCAAPAIKIGAMILFYKLAAAVIKPISDRRISGCISGMGEGARLFGKTMATAMVMLLLTIALVVSSTT